MAVEDGRKLRQTLGQRLMRKLVPPTDKLYTPWCTFVAIAAVICIFFFMAGGHVLPSVAMQLLEY